MGQNDLVKTLRMNYLFDFYQSLLTNKQKNYLELFYLQDYSLSEIADTFEVSRQAVYDNIRRTGDLVEDYESKLRLYQRFEKRRELYNLMKQSLNQPELLKQYITQLEELESDHYNKGGQTLWHLKDYPMAYKPRCKNAW